MTGRKRRQKFAKCAAFLSKAEWIKMKLLRTEVNEVAQVLGKKFTNFWLLNVVHVCWIFIEALL